MIYQRNDKYTYTACCCLEFRPSSVKISIFLQFLVIGNIEKIFFKLSAYHNTYSITSSNIITQISNLPIDNQIND